MTGRLARRLGIAGHSRVLLVGAPAAFDLGELPGDVLLTSAVPESGDPGAGEPSWDVIVDFCPDREALERTFTGLHRRLAARGHLWVAWSPDGDLDEAGVRAYGGEQGLTATAALAIDPAWPGVRFARP